MRSAEERKADFKRREDIRKAKYAERMGALHAKDADATRKVDAARAAVSEAAATNRTARNERRSRGKRIRGQLADMFLEWRI